MKLLKTLDSFHEVLQQLKQETAEAINEIRIDNPDAKPLGAGCFIVKTSSLSSDLVLSPLYHDFNAQFDILIDKLNKQSLDAFVRAIQELCKTGKVDGRRFHPTVIQKVSVLVKEEDNDD